MAGAPEYLWEFGLSSRKAGAAGSAGKRTPATEAVAATEPAAAKGKSVAGKADSISGKAAGGKEKSSGASEGKVKVGAGSKRRR
jgi:hypothetical protein